MTIDQQLFSFTDIIDLISFPVALTGKETGVKRYTVSFFKFHKLNMHCFMYNHNYNKILKSDWH